MSSVIKKNIAAFLFSGVVISSVTISQSAVAGSIYKCTVGGQTKYQDTPCASKESSTVLPGGSGVSDKPAQKLSLAEIYSEMQATGKLRREMEDGFRKDTERARQNLAGSSDSRLTAMEVERLKAKWLWKIQAAEQRTDELVAELRSRCPHGAALSPGHYNCSK